MATKEEMNQRILAAAESGDVDTLQDCIYKGAEVNCQDYYGQTPLHIAAACDITEVVDLLLKSGGSLSVVDNQGQTPLHRAAAYGRTKVVDLLLTSGASLSVVNNEGLTPLHWAATRDRTEVVDLLLNSGASPSVVDNKGQTPLHLAARWSSTELVYLLLKSGASLSVVDKAGKTAYDVAHGGAKDLLQEYMDMPSNTDEMDYQFRMDTSDEIKELLSKGTFTPYENCVYLGGASNVGKTTLASILIGAKIPLEWKSTDGLTIYFGRNGIDLKNKKMVPLHQGSDGGVLSKVLRGKPEIAQKPGTTLSKNSEDVQPQDDDKENIIKDNTLSTGAAPNPTPDTGNDDVNITSQENNIITTIQENIKEEIRKGTYKIEIAPSYLVDFGGQRSFDMTHQLFMPYKGTFVLMFNGQIDFSAPLKEYEEGDSTEAILKHWVNSILSYCVDDEDILPIIMFCATHRDHYKTEKNHEERRKKLIHGLVEMFKNHKLQHHIIYDDIFFINGMDENDHEINRLKSKLVEVAFQQESWGKQMPMAWVPLDLQMSQMRLHNKNIISKEELTTLNQGNEDLALTVEQIKYFLNVQHSLGKILYFDQHGLDNFIVVQPQSLVNILRSFITAEHFWPKDKELSSILCTLTNTGQIAKRDLLKLWSQEKFHQHMPNDDFKEFIIQFLVHLHILVEPKHRQEQESKVQSYFVPCIVKRRLPVHPDFYVKSADKMICLSYTLLKSSIPAALSFKLIGAAMNVWPLKETLEGICLYHQAAILCIDESNELHLLVEDDKVFVYLINEKNKGLISPNTAFTVQERLTLAMTKVLEFYHKSFGKSLSTSEASKVFEIEVGEWCTSGGGCYISVPEVKKKTEWRCKNNRTHQTKYPHYWIFDKENSTLGYQFPMMGTSDEMIKLLSKGTFLSYENCVYLGGACNVGKSTLASILIGENIPLEWKSTDGLTIYFGRNGINLKTKEMVPLKQGSDGDVLSKVLRGNPNIAEEKPDTTLSKNTEEVKPDTTLSKNKEEVKPDTTLSKNKEEVKPDTTLSKNREVKPDTTLSKNSEEVLPQDYDKENIIKDITLSTGAAPNQTPDTGNDDVNRTYKQQSQENYIITTLQENMKEEIRKGIYKIEIAPSDLVDFGGQRSFDMTHQLFMRYKGTFVLMFNGQIDFSVLLKEYGHGETTESILKHWVNSILSYCLDDEDDNDKDILPIIMFCATHSDAFNQKNHEERRKKLIHGLVEMFKNYKLQHRIIYDDIFFINGQDENDPEINKLKLKLVEVAFNQKSWGKRMPMAWVPLELQMSELRLHNMNIISKEELITLNQRNEDLALTVEQIKYFLNVQHSLGKILYFDQYGLDNFIVVQPQSLVNILRSFITDELFWPKDEELRGILRILTKTGKIAKQDLFKLWLQEKFHQHMPNDDFKEFIIQVLVHLDILVEPKHYGQEQGSKVQSYLVPCIVKRTLSKTDFYVKSAEKMICLSYTLLNSSMPTALSFKLIGAALNVWPLKETKEEGICLYHQAAILCIDESNELHLLVKDDKVFVYLINKKNKSFISPNIASVVQDCLTLTMTKVLEFYHKSFGKSLSTFEASKAFEIEVGDWCTSGGWCYISVPDLEKKTECIKNNKRGEWICKNNKEHDIKYPRYWICDKKQVTCVTECSGLDANKLALHPEDKHLFRLAVLITSDQCSDLVTKLGLRWAAWDDIKNNDTYDITVRKFFALCKWKNQMSKPSFRKLSAALSEDCRTHFLCQVFMEDVTVYDYADRVLQEKPEDDVLQDLSKVVGNNAVHLGVELGLSMATIEETLLRYPKSMFEQTFDVMKKWKISDGEVKTIRMLMKAFISVDRRGIDFLREKYRVNDHKNEAGEKTSADGDGNL